MKLPLLSLFFIVITFSACRPVHYIPNMDNVPILQEKGEGTASLGVSTAGRDSASQYSLHTSYLLTNHFAVKTNSVIYRFRRDFSRNRTRNSGQIHELGLGYIHNSENNIFNYGIWGIGGFGKMNTVIPIQNEQLSTNLFIIGINPTVSVVTNFYSLSFSMKSFYLKNYNINGNLEYSGVNEVAYLQKHNKAFILEPTFTEQIGFKNLRFIHQTTFSRNLLFKYNKEGESNDRQVNTLLSFGISYTFATRKKEKPIEF
ncbi:hypothetical protein Fleli_3988 [Bernardetia litoralis DSM 6794]|uniref:Outer membrane protein beta-barrel domain-containing protein n=1 Tax=Bernardetia litoralis (strain ATCC 23117 / DSM 6794 / NBRC 15988 / NCIMB 1366 / Fx l1 / Sio-4) TaxID=880071 RepID=I4AQQ5_BERLS|nr:hypothetical protein [Bernardetia litoralis]AFM06290.1 hypothetical protein Fleli_3988 [Bernardetia litoralis DSM 6794]